MQRISRGRVYCDKQFYIKVVYSNKQSYLLAAAGHLVEYGGIKTGDFRIDKDQVIEVGGTGKDFSQISDEDIANAALAVDNIDIASSKKIPLWAFGFLY